MDLNLEDDVLGNLAIGVRYALLAEPCLLLLLLFQNQVSYLLYFFLSDTVFVREFLGQLIRVVLDVHRKFKDSAAYLDFQDKIRTSVCADDALSLQSALQQVLGGGHIQLLLLVHLCYRLHSEALPARSHALQGHFNYLRRLDARFVSSGLYQLCPRGVKLRQCQHLL